MTDIEPPKENLLPINTEENFPENIEENKFQTEPQENQPSPNFLTIYQSFSLNPLEQILINKLIPNGYKLETEENLLKTDEKKKKGYVGLSDMELAEAMLKDSKAPGEKISKEQENTKEERRVCKSGNSYL